MTLMSPLVTGVHHHKGLRRNGVGAPPMGVVRWWCAWCPGMWLHGGRHGYMATELQGGVCFTIAITSSFF
jgi:hypothetical protein